MTDGFRHEALLYGGDDGFLAGTVPFIRDGLEAGETTLVMVGQRKLDALRDELGADANGRVLFANMEEVGANPARIIPAWARFADEHAGLPLRGIGEPIWADRSPDELVECQRHESLLNLAFADAPSFRLLCPYDADALGPDVIAEAECSHPHLTGGSDYRDSDTYRGLDTAETAFSGKLAEPAERPEALPFTLETLGVVRQVVSRHASEAGVSRTRTEDLVLAVDELAANSVRHGGGAGSLAIWREKGFLLCQVSDGGQIDDPLVGRLPPDVERIGGHGLWLANQLCDLVQVRSSSDGTVVRVHTRV